MRSEYELDREEHVLVWKQSNMVRGDHVLNNHSETKVKSKDSNGMTNKQENKNEFLLG